MYYNIRFYSSEAKYFDDDGIDTPIGHPSLTDSSERGFPTAQEVSDTVFVIDRQDFGRSNRVSHIFMTFGQFVDHDITLIEHPTAKKDEDKVECERRYVLKIF